MIWDNRTTCDPPELSDPLRAGGGGQGVVGVGQRARAVGGQLQHAGGGHQVGAHCNGVKISSIVESFIIVLNVLPILYSALNPWPGPQPSLDTVVMVSWLEKEMKERPWAPSRNGVSTNQ